MTQWYVAVEGRRYGPVTAEQLGTWAQHGRLTADDMVWREGMAEWVKAGTVEELGGLFAGAAAGGTAPAGVPPPTPPGGFAPAGAGPSAFLRPHRGATVLTLGILGLLLCFICGAIAWSMGNADLRDMAVGNMDRSGEGLTKAGKICGMISVILGIVSLSLSILWFVLAGSLIFSANNFAP